MIFLDTSFLFGYLVKDDPHHMVAVNLSSEIEDAAFITPDILKELVTVATYRISSDAAIKLFNAILDSESIKVIGEIENHINLTMEIFSSLGNHKLSYVDCSLIAVAQMLECRVLTFDKELEKALQ